MNVTGRRLGLSALVALASGALLTACAPPIPAGDGVVVITTDVSPQLADALEASFVNWTKTSNITVKVDRVDTLSAESGGDIGLWSSPQDLAAYAVDTEARDIAQLTSAEDNQWASRTLPGVIDPVTIDDGLVVGVPFSLGIDTLVYANPQAFAEHGYTLPATGADTVALGAAVTADETGYPWCAGVENGDATGEQFGAWLDYAILNTAGAETYRQWRDGDLTLSDPTVAAAVEAFEALVLNDAAVEGGRNGVAINGYANTAPLFEKAWRVNGQCLLYLGGSNIAVNFPESVVTQVAAGDDSRLAVLPLMLAESADFSLIASASYFSPLVLDEDVVDVLAFAASSEFATQMAATTGYLAPWISEEPVAYGDPVTTAIGELTQRAQSIQLNRFMFMTDDERADFVTDVMAYLTGPDAWSDSVAK